MIRERGIIGYIKINFNIMFDNYTTTNKSYNQLRISACSGGIYKTYAESWFKRFNLNSPLSEVLFRSPHEEYKYRECESKDYIILQMVLCGEMEVIAELIKKEDFQKYTKNNEQN